jgi:hypothetical protein
VSVKVELAKIGPTNSEPDRALLPVQLPLAVHELADELVHSRLTPPPAKTLFAFEVSVSAGAEAAGGGLVIATVTALEMLPALPRQASSKTAAACKGPTVSEPLVALDPDQPPLASQLLAPELVQLSVTVEPLATVCALAVRVSVGAV